MKILIPESVAKNLPRAKCLFNGQGNIRVTDSGNQERETNMLIRDTGSYTGRVQTPAIAGPAAKSQSPAKAPGRDQPSAASRAAARTAAMSGLSEAQKRHEARKKEMEAIRARMAKTDDRSADYAKNLNRYEQLVDEERDEYAQLAGAREKGPDKEMTEADRKKYTAENQKLGQDVAKTILGDDDGGKDGGHDLGKGRYLVFIEGDGDSMLSTCHDLLGKDADEGRTLLLNRNKFDPAAADYKFDTPRKDGLRDPDLVYKGDMVVIGADPDAVSRTAQSPSSPLPLNDNVMKKAAGDSFARHPGDAAYAEKLGALIGSPEFLKLNPEQQVEAIERYDQTVTSLPADKKLTDEQDTKLRQLLTSDGFYATNRTVRDGITKLFAENARGGDNARIDGLLRLVDNDGFKALDNQERELQVLDGYKNDSTYRANVDRLTGNTEFTEPTHKKEALDLMTRVRQYRRLYKDSNKEDRQTIMDNVYDAVTSERFRKFSDKKKELTINTLVKYGDREWARETGGAEKALDLAEQVR
jgi:hypothetical protein